MTKAARFIVLLLFLFQFTGATYGRSEYVPGYIIDIHNDTINGFVKNERWFVNPDKIAFKISKKRTINYYKPTDIHGFGFLNQRYVGAAVQKEVSPFWDSDLQKDPKLQLVSDTVFLQTLIGGGKPLYYFKDTNGKENFYIQEDSSMYSLLLHKTYVAYEPHRKEYHNMRFLGQLSRYFWDEPAMQDELPNTTYKRSSLEDLFHFYLKKQNIQTVYKNRDNKVYQTFGAVAGVSMTMIDVETDYIKARFGPSTNLTAGLSIDLAMAGRLRDWSFYNELMFSSYQAGQYVGPYFSNSWATFDFKYIRLNSLVRFRPSWFYLNAGISNSYVLHGYSSIFEDIRKYEIGILAGVGVRYRHFSLEVRGEIGDGMSPYVNMIAETHRIQLLLGYSF